MTAADRQFHCLDAIRGLAALWVLIGHAAGPLTFADRLWNRPVFYPILAVDLFILMSGFLMALHAIDRSAMAAPQKPSTWLAFWIRRFFRISPLYCVCFLAALVLTPLFADTLRTVMAVQGQAPDPRWHVEDRSLANIVLHLTYLAGLIPAYHWAGLLPDWSLSLEMQFYAAFPFIMLLIQRSSAWRGVLLLAGASVIVVALGRGYWSQFHLASPLPLKLPVFLAGICVAMALRASNGERRWLWSMTLALVALPLADRLPWWAKCLRVLLAAGLIALVEGETVSPRLRGVFARPVFRFLGDTSYGVYLTHLPCVIFGLALADRLVPGATAVTRFWLTLLVALPPTYGLAWCGCRFVERPGIRLGKHLLSYWRVPNATGGKPAEIKS